MCKARTRTVFWKVFDLVKRALSRLSPNTETGLSIVSGTHDKGSTVILLESCMTSRNFSYRYISRGSLAGNCAHWLAYESVNEHKWESMKSVSFQNNEQTQTWMFSLKIGWMLLDAARYAASFGCTGWGTRVQWSKHFCPPLLKNIFLEGSFAPKVMKPSFVINFIITLTATRSYTVMTKILGGMRPNALQ